jgi:hypothetical protein
VHVGKTLFARLMDFLPWMTFIRIIARYGGDRRVRTLSCGEQYRAMAGGRRLSEGSEGCGVGAGVGR